MSSGLELLDRHLRPGCVWMAWPEGLLLGSENLVQHGSRFAGFALPGERHGDLVPGFQSARMIGGQGARPGGQDVPEGCFCFGNLALCGNVLAMSCMVASVLGCSAPRTGSFLASTC